MNNEESSAQMLQEYLHRHAGGFGHAIECEQKQPDKSKRMISLPLTSQKQFLLLQAENPCPDMPVFRNGLPVTTTPDHKNHGFGVKSIQAIARKFGGSAHFQASDGWFVLKVLLPLPGTQSQRHNVLIGFAQQDGKLYFSNNACGTP